jgi:hypothetical protein
MLEFESTSREGKGEKDIPRRFPDIDLALLRLGGTRILSVPVNGRAAGGGNDPPDEPEEGCADSLYGKWLERFALQFLTQSAMTFTGLLSANERCPRPMCATISVAFCSTQRCSGSARRGRQGCKSCP